MEARFGHRRFQRDQGEGTGVGGSGDAYKNAVPGLIANIEGTKEVERDDIRLRTETFAEMWSDKTHFHLNARLEAYENDVLIFERDMQESIERDGL